MAQDLHHDPGQAATVAFLADPATHGAGGPVEVIRTHISQVFLAGERAFKLKRAVKLPYLDFSTPALRLAACEKEFTLNAATAPTLYRGVRRITRAPGGGLAFDGPGETADAVVEMARFDQDLLFDRMAVAGRLTPALMAGTAEAVARFHRGLPPVAGGGGGAAMAGVLDINRAGFAAAGLFGQDEVAALDAAFRAALGRHRAALDRRAAAGLIRRCHGDLHLRNICLVEGRPTLFDCIEFDDALATIDVLYDLAFLLMDLCHRGAQALASIVANRYCDAMDEAAGFALLPFLMAVRAAVRAHVEAARAAGDAASPAAAEARAYADLARRLLAPASPRLVAIGGLSGSGKSTIAEMLAPHVGLAPGARTLETDRIRKALFAVPAETRLGPEAYAPEVSETVYRMLGQRVEEVLAAGGPVVVSAVFDRRADRDEMAEAARRAGVAFTGLWLRADAETLRGRVRRRTGGPSDATVEVLDRQLARAGDVGDWIAVDAGGPPEAVLAAARARLGL